MDTIPCHVNAAHSLIRHRSNSDMIVMFNHLGCSSTTILGIAGQMGQRTHGGGIVDNEWIWDQRKRRENVKRTGS